MILTNRLGLPRSIENAVRNDRYSRGDAHISVTGLIGPARKRAIEIGHADEITEDVSDRIWALYGQIVHGILERADDQAWCEERLFIERHGWRISGQFDRYLLEADGLLQDYKLTSSYAVRERVKPEWEAQQNLYSLMLREHGYRVDRLQVVALLRDWQKAKAKHDPLGYPQRSIAIIDVEMWPNQQIEDYITQRLIAHGRAQHELPECNAEERWERPAIYAIMKRGNSRAISVHKSEDEARATLAALQAQETMTNPKQLRAFSITERPADNRRCEDYCPALPFCEQGQKLVQAKADFAKAKMWSVSAAQ